MTTKKKCKLCSQPVHYPNCVYCEKHHKAAAIPTEDTVFKSVHGPDWKKPEQKCECHCHNPDSPTAPMLCIMGVCYKCSKESMQKPDLSAKISEGDRQFGEDQSGNFDGLIPSREVLNRCSYIHGTMGLLPPVVMRLLIEQRDKTIDECNVEIVELMERLKAPEADIVLAGTIATLSALKTKKI